jgi:hypothetical protein
VKTLAYFIFYAVIFFIFFFGLIQFLPKTSGPVNCTYTLKPFLQNKYVRINYPAWHKQCDSQR